MKFHLITTVWGDWHIGAMEKVMWPTLLASGNLPALKDKYDIVYKIFTTRKDAPRIEAIPHFQKIKELSNAEICIASEKDNPPDYEHLQWWHNSIAEAREAGALISFFPPDVVWSNCCVGNMGKAMATGKIAVAMPYIRVLSETCIPELVREVGKKDGGIMDFSPSYVVKHGLRHLHPLSACLFPNNIHTHPTMEKLWMVEGEGAVLRAVNREAFAFDPTRTKASNLVYATDIKDLSEIHFVDNSDDMIMLSLVPMTKDLGNLGIYLPNHNVNFLDIARNCLHPDNYTPFNIQFARKKIRLRYAEPTESKWKKAERKSDKTYRSVVVAVETLRIWEKIKEAGCTMAAKLLAVALQQTSFAGRWRHEKPLTIFVPTDEAFKEFSKKKIHDLVRKGSEHLLLDFIYNHIALGDDAKNLNGHKMQFQIKEDQESVVFDNYTIRVVENIFQN